MKTSILDRTAAPSPARVIAAPREMPAPSLTRCANRPDAGVPPHRARPDGRRLHYAWIVVAVTSLTLMVSAGVRAAPSVFIKPLEAEFGWDRASISLAISLSILALGLGGPVSGSLIDRFGPRRVMLGATVLIGPGLIGLLGLSQLWQLHVLWGLVVGVGTGGLAQVLGAAVAHRWFQTRRGLAVGLFGASTSAGQVIFIPAMIALTAAIDWRSAIGLLAVATLALLLPVALWMRDQPRDVGLLPVGVDAEAQAGSPEVIRGTSLREAVRTRDFWLLAGTFFSCGYTSNGLIGTHLIPHAVEHGFSEATAAGTMVLLSAMSIVGTLASGYLTDRYDNRKLLAIYYGFRALSIAALPFILEVPHLLLFGVVCGLDWAATIPPTTNLTARRFGRSSLGTLFGWIFFAHMVGAALAAFAGGFFRDVLGDYHLVFVSAALLGFGAAFLALAITPPKRVGMLAVGSSGRTGASLASRHGGRAPVALAGDPGVAIPSRLSRTRRKDGEVDAAEDSPRTAAA